VLLLNISSSSRAISCSVVIHVEAVKCPAAIHVAAVSSSLCPAAVCAADVQLLGFQLLYSQLLHKQLLHSHYVSSCCTIYVAAAQLLVVQLLYMLLLHSYYVSSCWICCCGTAIGCPAAVYDAAVQLSDVVHLLYVLLLYSCTMPQHSYQVNELVSNVRMYTVNYTLVESHKATSWEI